MYNMATAIPAAARGFSTLQASPAYGKIPLSCMLELCQMTCLSDLAICSESGGMEVGTGGLGEVASAGYMEQ